MFRSLTKSFSGAALALGLSLGSAGLASAQTDADRGGAGGETRTGNTGNTGNTGTARTNDNGFDWGLLGLLGLAGLIPLFVRRDNRHHDHTTATGRGTARV